MYKKGLNVELAHQQIKGFFEAEFKNRINGVLNTKIKNSTLNRVNKKTIHQSNKNFMINLKQKQRKMLKKQGDIVLNVDQDFMSISKSNKSGSDWKKTFTVRTTNRLANDLNNVLKQADKDTPNTPTWLNSAASKAKDDDRAYKLLKTLIPGENYLSC
ncbi:Uncharacterised protein [Streptococcus pneumoniae]|nr:Uncharacterised protein [Streptococcus pneumoniae]